MAECAAAAVCAVSAPATVSFPLLPPAPAPVPTRTEIYLLLLESHTIQYTIHKHRTAIGGSILYIILPSNQSYAGGRANIEYCLYVDIL